MGARRDLFVAGFHSPLAVGPVVHRFGPKVVAGGDRTDRIQLGPERILYRPTADSGEESIFVSTGVAADIPPMATEAACQRQDQKTDPIFVIVVPELVGPHAAGDQCFAATGGD